jgi:hypothetical protein
VYYEIRRYQAQPGRRQEWVRYMEDVVIPFQASLGMDVTASFVDAEDEDGYVWIRRFEDEAQSEALYAAVYEHDRWKNEIGPVVYDLLILEKSVITRVVPTPASPHARGPQLDPDRHSSVCQAGVIPSFSALAARARTLRGPSVPAEESCTSQPMRRLLSPQCACSCSGSSRRAAQRLSNRALRRMT